MMSSRWNGKRTNSQQEDPDVQFYAPVIINAASYIIQKPGNVEYSGADAEI